MSNLGAYQVMTALAKKVGGPFALAAVTAVSGWAVGRSSEAGAKALWRWSRARRRGGTTSCPEAMGLFSIATDIDCGSGLVLHEGDKIRILERDGEAVLIEVIGGAGNPYVVSAETLTRVSDFNDDSSEGRSGSR